MVKKRASNGRNKKVREALYKSRSSHTDTFVGPRSRQAHPLLQLLAMHTQGQGYQEIHHKKHGRVRRHPYVDILDGAFIVMLKQNAL
jgi:hypothetical protein